MKKFIIIFSFALFLVSCGGGDSTPVDIGPTKVTAVVADGETFYQYECSGCHSAGLDETSAFGSSNLAQKQDLIQSDLSRFGGTPFSDPDVKKLMGRFSNLSKQRVADLKAYLTSL
jgi:mono/diheme cytochrome c family protein